MKELLKPSLTNAKRVETSSIFDLTKRIDLRSANRKCMESLAVAGAFDGFENSHRAQYFFDDGSGPFLEKAIKFGASTRLLQIALKYHFLVKLQTFNCQNHMFRIASLGETFKS